MLLLFWQVGQGAEEEQHVQVRWGSRLSSDGEEEEEGPCLGSREAWQSQSFSVGSQGPHERLGMGAQGTRCDSEWEVWVSQGLQVPHPAAAGKEAVSVEEEAQQVWSWLGCLGRPELAQTVQTGEVSEELPMVLGAQLVASETLQLQQEPWVLLVVWLDS